MSKRRLAVDLDNLRSRVKVLETNLSQLLDTSSLGPRPCDKCGNVYMRILFDLNVCATCRPAKQKANDLAEWARSHPKEAEACMKRHKSKRGK